MGFGRGMQDLLVQGPGDSDSWGGPENGIDLIRHMGSDGAVGARAQRNPDTMMFLTIVGAVVILWLLAGVVLKSAKAAG